MMAIEGDVELIGDARNPLEVRSVIAVALVWDAYLGTVIGSEGYGGIADVAVSRVVVHGLSMADTNSGPCVGDISLNHVSHIGIVVIDVDLFLTGYEEKSVYYIYKV